MDCPPFHPQHLPPDNPNLQAKQSQREKIAIRERNRRQKNKVQGEKQLKEENRLRACVRVLEQENSQLRQNASHSTVIIQQLENDNRSQNCKIAALEHQITHSQNESNDFRNRMHELEDDLAKVGEERDYYYEGIIRGEERTQVTLRSLNSQKDELQKEVIRLRGTLKMALSATRIQLEKGKEVEGQVARDLCDIALLLAQSTGIGSNKEDREQDWEKSID
ncbi:MAG: hypothetical protein Q9217_006014 [Psora testacea]